MEVFVSALGSVSRCSSPTVWCVIEYLTTRRLSSTTNGVGGSVSTEIEAGGGKRLPCSERLCGGTFPSVVASCALHRVHFGPLGGTTLGARKRRTVPHSALHRPNRR